MAYTGGATGVPQTATTATTNNCRITTSLKIIKNEKRGKI
jgi:hypothetical protein